MKPFDRAAQYRRGLLLSYLNLAVGMLIPFFYTRAMLSLLGQSEYGLYKLAVSTAGNLSLLSFGLGSALSHFLLRTRTREGEAAMARMLGLLRVLMDAAAVLTLAVGALLAANAQVLYGASLSDRELRRMRLLLLLLAANTAVGFSSNAYVSLVFVQEHFVFARTVDLLCTVLLPCADLAVLYLWQSSVGLAAVSLAVGILTKISYAFYVKRRMRLRPVYRDMPVRALGDIMHYCFWTFLGGIVAQVFDATDMVILGATPELAANAAAVYSVGATFSELLFRISQIAPAFFEPKLSRMVFGSAAPRELDAEVIRLGRVQAFTVLLICSGFVAFGRQFIALYAGEAYEGAYAVALLLMLPNCIGMLQSGAFSVLRAKGLHRFRAIVYLGIAAGNLALTLLLVERWGILGAAIPTGAAYLIGHGIVMNVYYHRRVGLDIPLFWRRMLPVFVQAAVLCGAACAFSERVNLTAPVHLLLAIALYTLLWGAGLWLFVLDAAEKQRLRAFFGTRLRAFFHEREEKRP